MRKLTLWAVGLLLSYQCLAQTQTIEIKENQTSHLIFPSDILYTDIGDNENFIADYTNNILRVKGIKTDKQTNLTVLTKDQHYYSFFVRYSPTPRLNYFITPKMAIKILGNTDNKSPPSLPTNQSGMNQPRTNTRKVNLSIRKNTVEQEISSGANPSLYQKAVTLLSKPHLYDYIGARHGDIQLKVTGIYHSLFEFGIKERKRPKKSALHEKKLAPLFTVKEEITRVLPHQVNEYVAVFGKITVPNDRLFYMEVVEEGRNITLDILFHKLPIKRIR